MKTTFDELYTIEGVGTDFRMVPKPRLQAALDRAFGPVRPHQLALDSIPATDDHSELQALYDALLEGKTIKEVGEISRPTRYLGNDAGRKSLQQVYDSELRKNRWQENNDKLPPIHFFTSALMVLMLLFAPGLCAQNPNSAAFPGAIATDGVLLVASNNGITTLGAAMSNSQTTIVLVNATGFIVPSAYSVGSEIVMCTTLTGSTLSGCTRGWSGTTPVAHNVGASISENMIAWYHNQSAAEIKAVESSLGTNLSNIAYVGQATSQALGAPCTWAPPIWGHSNVAVTNSGTAFSCTTPAGSTVAFWIPLNGRFQIALGAGSAVPMTGSPTPIYSVPLPSLPESACYSIAFSSSALSNGTVMLAIDGTAVNTLITGATVASVDVDGLIFCNFHDDQTTQGFATVGIVATALAPFWTLSNTPSAMIDWSSNHVLTINVNQASGSVTPLTATIQEVH